MPKRRADYALQQTLREDHADDGAPRRADRAQQAQIAAAFGDDRAEGVEDDEAAHHDGQHAEQIDRHFAELKIREQLIADFQTAQLEAAAQPRLHVGFHLRPIGPGGQHGFDRVDLIRLIEQLLRGRQRHIDRFDARQRTGRDDADDIELGRAGS